MAHGTVKWFNSEKGFGFITPDGGGADLFAHYAEIEGKGYRTLEEGQRVEFDLGQGTKGPQAMHIRPLHGAAAPPPTTLTSTPTPLTNSFVAPPAPVQGPRPAGTVFATGAGNSSGGAGLPSRSAYINGSAIPSTMGDEAGTPGGRR